MPELPAASTSYRNPKVEDDDDDDLDDLDDVLSSFNKPSTSKRPLPASPPKAPTAGSSGPQPSSGTEQQATVADDEDFEASLVEGMESLLRQLAGDHPPGPMPDTTDVKSDKKETLNPADLKPGSTEASPAGIGLSPEEEEAAWQRAVEMMLSGEGLEALGLDKSGIPNSAPPLPDRGAPVKEEKKGEQLDFDETIRRTMEQLKSPRGKSRGGGESNGAPDIAALLAQLGSDPSALEGLGEGDDELGGLLDGMMAQLMTKEILEEPMAELASKYPEYLSSPPAGTTKEDLEKYKQQHKLVSAIVETFRKPDYSDEKDSKAISKLVGEMQDLGGPPQEIMGDLPEGFDLGALGNEEQCTIM